jgi:signal transduction histidine kinase
MARELHDVVGHGVTLMVVQAGAGRGVVHHDPSRAEAVFRTIEETGRSALGELDRLLGILRPEGEQAPRAPSPGLDQLPALVERFVEAGLAVEVEVEGEATPLPAAVESAIYRVTQEALTNTLRHAGTATATVRLGFLAGRVELEVTDDGPGVSSRSAQGGRGLVGIRERMDLLGGEVDTAPRPGGGFLVHCRIPLPAS